ncbi:MAG: hypothetical protein HY590_00410 [Candidatus Omnitrophica bacterium]|nr:hypothetical protein [Candidatus Omnitrophota bacterium]
MIDRDLEEKIKKSKEFMDLWVKFHNLYKEALKDKVVDPEEEKAFLETKSLIARKYQALTDLLKITPSTEDKTIDVISQVLSLQGISALSDVQLEEIENGWHHSNIFLNKLLGSLENRKESLSKIHPLSVLFPKIFSACWTKPVRRVTKAVIVLILAYFILIRGLHLDEKARIFLSGFPPLQGFLKALESDSEEEE